MLLDLSKPTAEVFSPNTFLDAVTALADSNLLIRGANGKVYKPELRDAYLVQLQVVIDGGAQGMYNTPKGYQTFCGAISFFYSLLLVEAALAGAEVDEDDIPFGDNHVDSGVPEANPLTPEEIDAMMASFDSDWANNSLDNPDAPI